MFSTQTLNQLLTLFLGSLLLALGVVLFFIGNHITTGGSPGMALLLHHMTGYSIGSMFLIFNLILLLIGMKYMGKGFAFRTVVSIALTSFCIDLFVRVFPLENLTEDMFLATLFGGVVIGLGVGLILKSDASAGGSTIIAKILSAHSEIKPSQVILVIDFLTIAASVYVFIDIQSALWSVFSIYITARSIDVILSGRPSKKIVHLVTKKSDLLSQKIMENLGYHGTVVHGNGLREGQEKSIIFIIVELNKLRILRELIKAHDPDAFMVVMDASELLGRGN